MVGKVLQRPTLILNRSWQPVHVATVARALMMMYRGTARAVDPTSYQTYDWSDWASLEIPDDASVVRSVSLKVLAPEIVTLLNYDRQPQLSVTFSRRNLFKRDRFTCQYCGVQPGPRDLTIDHVEPRARGGESTWENCVVACVACNSSKADRTLKQMNMKLRKPPEKPRWRPHFAYDSAPITSWANFVSEMYWTSELNS